MVPPPRLGDVLLNELSVGYDIGPGRPPRAPCHTVDLREASTLEYSDSKRLTRHEVHGFAVNVKTGVDRKGDRNLISPRPQPQGPQRTALWTLGRAPQVDPNQPHRITEDLAGLK